MKKLIEGLFGYRPLALPAIEGLDLIEGRKFASSEERPADWSWRLTLRGRY